MGHISVYRRMLIWGIGTTMALIGVIKAFIFPARDTSFFIYLFLFVSGAVIVLANEIIYGLRKEQLQIDRDETIKGEPLPPTILAICPECKSRIPSESKYCPECGTDLTITVLSNP